VRVGRRVELTVDAADEPAARAVVERLASELLANPLIEAYAIEAIAGASSAISRPPATAGERHA
jgi:phosphoribosylformylglycinamidine (FGAM) synthase PurS component